MRSVVAGRWYGTCLKEGVGGRVARAHLLEQRWSAKKLPQFDVDHFVRSGVDCSGCADTWCRAGGVGVFKRVAMEAKTNCRGSR